MSSSGRRPRGINIFENNFQGTSEEAANQIFNSDSIGISEQRQVAKPVGIFEIAPDLTQPRRIVPSAVRHLWNGEPEGVSRLYDLWLKAIAEERSDELNLYAYLTQTRLPEDISETADFPDVSGPLERSLLSIAQLAISIRQIGLTNPITVVRSGRNFRLETGERRWMAYHMLNRHFPDEDWSKIPARQVEHLDVWRQASENNARADLNAIGKTRQLAILMMDVLRDRGFEFHSYETVVRDGGHERDYYAQVADGEQFRLPRGTSEKLLNVMGWKNPVQIRQYRTLLRLPSDIWEYADDRNLSEFEIRNLDFDTVRGVTVSDDTVSDSYGMDEDDPTNPFVEPINKRRRSKIWSYANRLDSLSKNQLSQALADIQAEKRWLEELEKAMRNRTDEV